MQRKWRRDWDRMKETHSGYAKGTSATIAKYILPPLMAAGLVFGSLGLSQAAGLPDGGKITSGSGTMNQSGNTLDIHQTSGRLGIDWQSFSIDKGNTVNFYQPGRDSIALNRVLGNDASNIYGNLNANGQVFLCNPNGVLFAKGAQVNVGGLVASTLNLSDSDFQNAANSQYTFTGNGSGTGTVVNEGAITAADGGYVALLGTNVANNGVIVAQKGTTALGAGQAVTLNFNGDGLLNLAVSQAALNASAANHNLIQADGGQVIMTARAANALAGSVVNNSGIIEARGLENRNGVITLDGGTSGTVPGTVTNSGTLDASGKAGGQTGGTVKVLGDKVGLTGTSTIDVSGDKGGGTALVGGNFQGKGPEPNARTTTVAAGASINADAITSGNGGKVAVWSDDKTVFSGTISARGGSQSGDGGQVETSGHHTLTLSKDAKVVTTAPQGQVGNWLLDPTDYTIGTGATGANYWNNVDLGNSLNSTGITVQTATTGSDAGDITVTASVSWSSANSLTLSAYHDVDVYGDIQNSGGAAVKLRADNTGTGSGTVNFTDGSSTGHVFTDGAVNIYYNPASYGDSATQTTWDAAAGLLTGPYGAYVNKADGITANNKLRSYMLVNDVNQLQNIGNSSTSTYNTTGVYALGRDIDASVTRTWNNGQGFAPITDGTQNKGFTGIFDGDGHTIANLYINSTFTSLSTPLTVGLFAKIGQGGTVRNLSLTNVDITGTNKYQTDEYKPMGSSDIIGYSCYVGGLAGMADSATVDNVSVTGKVTGNQASAVGGLAGLVLESRIGSHDSVVNSSSTAAVTANGVGNQTAVTVDEGKGIRYQSMAGGQIAAGGLIGELDYNSLLNGGFDNVLNSNDSNFVRNSYSSGPVTVNYAGLDGIQHATFFAGGLVGVNRGGSIDQSYSTGTVTVHNSDAKSTVYAGGLVGASGDNAYTERGSYDTVWLDSTYTGEKISNSYSTGKVSYSGDQTRVGGFVGSNSGASTISQSFWDTDRSGQTQGVGTNTGKTLQLTGLTSAQAADHKSYSGWDFASTWFMLDGYTTPFLRSEYSTIISNAHQLQLMALDPMAKYTLAADLDLRGYNMAPGVGFVPITGFTGSLDGGGHTVSYLTIHDYDGGDAVGLFGHIAGGAVHDLALANATVSGTAANQSAGILAGVNDGSIYNTYTGGTVSGSGSVGGIAGSNTGTLTASFSSAKVAGPAAAAGGLVGTNSGTVSASYLDADSSVNGSAGGPVAGSNTGTLTAPDYSDGNWVSYGGNKYLAWTVAPDGTVGLYTPSELQAIQNYLSGSYRLRADLDLAGRNWTAVGTGANAFTGSLDGSGYVINNLTISNSPLTAIGLFGYTQGATLSNLTLTNVNIAGAAGNTYVGGLVGYSEGGTVSNAAVDGTVTATGDNACVGGLTGVNSGSGIAAARSAVTVTAAGTGSYAGGIAGLNAAGGSLSSSYNTGAVTVTGAGSNVGGLTGQNDGTINASYNTGTVASRGTNSAGSYAGGVAGRNTGAISNDYNLVYNSGAVITEGDNSVAGGIVGQNTGTGSIGTDAWDLGLYNTGRVTAQGTGSSVGGIAGDNAANGAIFSAYNEAVVTAAGASSNVGGIAGVNSGTIQSAYFGATDSGLVAQVVSSGASSSVGGIAGVNNGSIADTNSFACISSTGAHSNVGGLVGMNNGSLATSYALGAVQGSADSNVGGLIGSNTAGTTVDSLIWNPDSAFAITDPRYSYKVGVGSGPDTGTKALSYAEMLDPSNSNWSAFSNWNTKAGYFPVLSWQPSMMYGRVEDGGSGVTVNRYTNDRISGSIARYQTQTFGADGLYFMSSAGTAPHNGTDIAMCPFQVMLLTVEGQPYKANSVFPEMSDGTFYDLKKDTLLLSVPFWDPKMSDAAMTFGFDFKRLFADPVSSGAVVAALADNYSDLLFTVKLYPVFSGQWNVPGGFFRNFYRYDLDVTGNFAAKNIHLSNDSGDDGHGLSCTVGGSITTHRTDYARGDISVDNSQLPTSIESYAGNSINYRTDKLLSPIGDETKYSADGDITINTSENFAIGVGSGQPIIIAGGDITINSGGYFVNWDGPNAIKAGGRYLIYAKDMLLPNWLSPSGTSAKYYATSSYLSQLFYNTKYLDSNYQGNLKLEYLNDKLVADTRGGLPGFVLWGTAYDPNPTYSGSGFIYTADDPTTDAGIAARLWMTPDYFATQQRRQWANGAAQAGGNNPGLSAASSPAAGAVSNDALSLTVVDGGVALPPAAGRSGK
ncbi:filamentous hemagglutinin family protein [Sporomusaceae bacterium BoRhaA]|uniref:two-partner secretion domain-containing protein n=1 Tax=Pelorhabdus rhamnosifermentans TaxID=2772457 RepID=UPI001C0619DE|nr:filamentous hemagglutinin N-terminal domain-containing protein [Pelorhabdus rhamnosifermentans]MBU2700962.1 filamentous hemagglutinin family protein [Pelorhabdus rhamnosifermentans]